MDGQFHAIRAGCGGDIPPSAGACWACHSLKALPEWRDLLDGVAARPPDVKGRTCLIGCSTVCDAQGTPKPPWCVSASLVFGAVSESSRLCVGRTRESAHRRRHGTDVLELMPNP